MILAPIKEAEEARRDSTPVYELVGWGIAGIFVRSLALGMQGKSIYYRPHIHFIVAASFAAVGYQVIKWEKSQLDLLQINRERLVKRRLQREGNKV